MGVKPVRLGRPLAQSETGIFIEGREGAVYHVPFVAYVIWMECNGERTVREIIAVISREAEAPEEEVRGVVIAAIRELARAGLVTYEGAEEVTEEEEKPEEEE